jgi:hypothetical protein
MKIGNKVEASKEEFFRNCTDDFAMRAEQIAKPIEGFAMCAEHFAKPIEGFAMPADTFAMPTDKLRKRFDNFAMRADGFAKCIGTKNRFSCLGRIPPNGSS